MIEGLDGVADVVRPILDSRFTAREFAIATGRKVIRSSANAIRALHRGDDAEGRRLIGEAGDLLESLHEATVDHPELRFVGYAEDAAKEFAEASLTAAIFAGEPIPLNTDLGIDPVPYLHGLGETVGECRRRLLDALRDGRLTEAESLLQAMNAIVDLLASLDYPDGMTSGLMRTTDVSRALVERSRSDLTSTVVQDRLRAQIERLGLEG